MSGTAFFSTLAQATSAVVGLVAVFLTSLYTVQTSTRREAKNRFREELRSFDDEYRPVIKKCHESVKQYGNYERDFLGLNKDEYGAEVGIQEYARKQPDSRAADFYARSRYVEQVLTNLMEASTAEEIRRGLTDLEYHLGMLKTLLSPRTYSANNSRSDEEFYNQIRHRDGDTPDNFRQREILELNEPFVTWLEDRGLSNRHDTVSIETLSLILNTMSDDFVRVNSRFVFPSRILTAEQMKLVLLETGLIFLVGVLLPTSALIDVERSTLLPSGLVVPPSHVATLQITYLSLTVVGLLGMGYHVSRMISAR